MSNPKISFIRPPGPNPPSTSTSTAVEDPGDDVGRAPAPWNDEYVTPALQFKTLPATPATPPPPSAPAAASVTETPLPPEPSSILTSSPYQLPEDHHDTNRLEEIFLGMTEQDPDMLVFTVAEPLTGILDFGFLGDRSLREIHLADHGHVTDVRGLPPTLQKFTCRHNELRELSHLPASLLELHVSHNQLSTLDFSQTPQLTLFHGEHNRLYSVEDLPATLEEMYVSHNRLSELNLIGLTRLRVLHCEHNKHPLILKHVPSQPIQIRMDKGPLNHIQTDADEDADAGPEPTKKTRASKLPEYTHALQSYMMYKSKYAAATQKWREKRRSATKTTKVAQYPPCVQCAANVGMTFTHKNREYHASCGATHGKKNCDFVIHLNAGYYVPFHDFLNNETARMDQEKQGFMQQKMQTLFGYLPEKDSAELFIERVKTYAEDLDTTAFFVNEFKAVYNDPSRRDVIDMQIRKMAETRSQIASLMHEYKTDVTNRALLHDAIESQVQTLVPETEKLRQLKYPTMEVNQLTNHDGEVLESRLFQRGFRLDQIVYELNAPQVLAYRVGGDA